MDHHNLLSLTVLIINDHETKSFGIHESKNPLALKFNFYDKLLHLIYITIFINHIKTLFCLLKIDKF